MTRALLLLLLLLSTSAPAQAPQQQQLPPPTPEEVAFARLPADIRQRLAGYTPAQAMQIVAQTGQHAIATGNPYPSAGQFRSTLGALLDSYSTYTSASAGETSFPPLSPLVAPPPPPFLR
jgi:hypothetical protein